MYYSRSWAEGYKYYEHLKDVVGMNNSRSLAEGFRCYEQLREIEDMGFICYE